MTERKIVLYLEQKTFFEHKKISIPFSGDKWKEWGSAPDLSRLVTYEIYNSFNPTLAHLFYNKGWNQSILIDLRKNSNKIALVSWDVAQKHLCKNIETIYSRPEQNLFSITIDDVLLKKNISVMLKVKSQEYYTRQKAVPTLFRSLDKCYNKEIDYFISKNVFRREKHRYRLYLGSRLLVERYYPVDLEYNRMLAETIYLNEAASGEIRLESDFDLQIKRVEVNGQKQDIYSSSFQLPHADK